MVSSRVNESGESHSHAEKTADIVGFEVGLIGVVVAVVGVVVATGNPVGGKFEPNLSIK